MNSKPKKTLVLILFFLISVDSGGTNNPPSASVEAAPVIFDATNDPEFMLSVGLIILLIISFVFQLFYVFLTKKPFKDELSFFVLPLLIFGTLYLITAGYTNDQIAPVSGLFGTIAGYLLAKERKSQINEHED